MSNTKMSNTKLSIARLGQRLLSTVVPTVTATANCGRCTETPTTRCCRPNFRRFAYVDACGQVCYYRCLERPTYC